MRGVVGGERAARGYLDAAAVPPFALRERRGDGAGHGALSEPEALALDAGEVLA